MLEAMVALSLFSIVMVTSLGALLSIIDANSKAQTLKLAINNLNFGIEKMSRDIRSGQNYFCGDPSGNLAPSGLGSYKDCVGGSEAFAFRSKYDGTSPQEYTMYYLDGTGHVKVETYNASRGTRVSELFTSDIITFDSLKFFVNGSNPNLIADQTQPTVTVVMRGVAGGGKRVQSDFNIQTTVSKRALDVQ